MHYIANIDSKGMYNVTNDLYFKIMLFYEKCIIVYTKI